MVTFNTENKTKASACTITPISTEAATESLPSIPCTFDNNTLLGQAFSKYNLQPQTPLAQTFFTEPMTDNILSDEDRALLLAIAQKWNGNTTIQYERGACSSKKIDCSNLVAKIYAEAGYPYPYTPSSGDWQAAGFEKTDLAQAKPGDVIRWNGHVGIVIDPVKRTFLAISSTATHDPIRISSFAEGTDWASKPFDILQFQKSQA